MIDHANTFEHNFDVTGGLYTDRTLRCVRGNGEVLFDAGHGPVWTSIRPAPAVDTPASTGCYDLSGRKLAGRPQKGIYLMNGKNTLHVKAPACADKAEKREAVSDFHLLRQPPAIFLPLGRR